MRQTFLTVHLSPCQCLGSFLAGKALESVRALCGFPVEVVLLCPFSFFSNLLNFFHF